MNDTEESEFIIPQKPKPIRTLEDIFDRCEKQEDGCWRWKSSRFGLYGAVYIGGRRQLTHRVVMEMVHGRKLMRDEFVCHKCNFKLCCNPDHLYVGDAATNAKDWSEKCRAEKMRAKAEDDAELERFWKLSITTRAEIVSEQKRKREILIRNGGKAPDGMVFPLYPTARFYRNKKGGQAA